MLVPFDLWHLKVKLSFALSEKVHEQEMLLYILMKNCTKIIRLDTDSRVGWAYIVNGNASFDAAQCKTSRLILLVFKDSHATMLLNKTHKVKHIRNVYTSIFRGSALVKIKSKTDHSTFQEISIKREKKDRIFYAGHA